MTEPTELMPCPFCGGNARKVKHSAGSPGTTGYDRWHGVACAGCNACVGARDRRFRTLSAAIAAWNRRTPQPTQPAPQQEAQEPVMIYHGDCIIDCGEHGHHHVELLRMIPAGSKLYTAPQPTPTPQADSQPAQDERDDFEKVFPLPSGCIRVGTGYASTGYSNWAAHTHCERWQGWRARAARPPAYSVQDLQPVHDAVTIDLLNERVAYLERKLKEADSVLEDAARLDWLLLHISGAEFRRIGVHYSGNASRADVDAARTNGDTP